MTVRLLFFCLFFSFQAFALETKQCLVFEKNTLQTKKTPDLKNGIKLSTIESDFASKQGEITTFKGNVVLHDKDTIITADSALMNKSQDDDLVEFSGNVKLINNKNTISGPKLTKKINSQQTHAEQSYFIDYDAKLRGFAQVFNKKNDTITEMEDVYFTSCPPEKEDWRFRSKRIITNNKTQQGKAEGVVFEFKNIPVFYSPFFFFSIGNDRLSGFLTPSITTSNRNGINLSVPYYFNIAPNIDNVLTTKIKEKSDVSFNNKTRLLTQQSYWELESDIVLNDAILNQPRHSARLTQTAKFDLFKMDMDISIASDKDYFADFGNSIATSNLSHLKRNINFYTPIANKDAHISILSYQTLDEKIVGSSRPYQLLPQVNYSNNHSVNDIDLNYSTQWTNFERENSTVGHRFHIKPSASKLYQGAAWDFTPKIALDLTQYSLTKTNNDTLNESRILPIITLDSRVYFEKNTQDALQILEPRLFYLYVPFEDQSTIPNFDTGKFILNFDQFYRDNLFSGNDKVQNANQLTSSISLKEVNALTGKTAFKVQTGIISYFEQPKVQLTSETLSNESTSNLLFQWDGYFPNNVSSQYFAQYDQQNDSLTRQTAFLRYNNSNKIINSSWSKETIKEQYSLSAYWPITNYWQIVGRYDYSIDEEKEILSLLGFEYDNCCFQFRVNYSRTPVVNSTEVNERTTFQLVFKSLSEPSLGIGQKWQKNIIGYSDPYQ